MTTRLPDDLVAWLPWNEDVFARAARERKPVLLSITAAWCQACREMDRTTYMNEQVATVIRDRFVAIRVDADQRPDINERYNLGGWPTTAFLTAAGELLGGGTFVSVERMPGVLQQVIEAIATRGSEIARAQSVRAGERTIDAPGPEASLADVVTAVFISFDDMHGGFGIEPKFPLTAPLHVALALYREQEDEKWRTIVERTLDAIRDGGLHDSEGGFFRYATTRDWQLPHLEKLLETNASLLRVYAEAALAFDNSRYRDTCAEVSEYISHRLIAASGGYYGSEADTIVYTDTSAAASAALLTTAALSGDVSLGQHALEQLERMLLTTYRPGEGVAHYLDGTPRVRGLLTDHVALVLALLDAQEASGGEPYEMLAEELAHHMLQTMWDGEAGGFFDRAPEPVEVGLLQARRKPFVLNSDAARALARLARTSGEPEFRLRAEATARTLAHAAPAQGPLGAHYVLAMRELSVR
jgi:uncharacterized protein